MQPKYVIDGVEHQVAPHRVARETTVAIDGHLVDARIDHRGPNECDLTIRGKVHRIYYAQDERQMFLHIDGKAWALSAVDEFQGARSHADLDRDAILAPMPGVVVSIGVSVGDSVVAGQALILIESMKLQCELRAKANGIVKAVSVGVGASFERGAALIELNGLSEDE